MIFKINKAYYVKNQPNAANRMQMNLKKRFQICNIQNSPGYFSATFFIIF